MTGVDNFGYEPNHEEKSEKNATNGITDISVIDLEKSDKNGNVSPEKDPEPDLEDGGPKRAQWGNGVQFLMSCIAMSVGLGNIWRFPFTAYNNGGGAFLIPYLIVLILIGRPVYYLEMCLGQFSSRGNVKMFEALAPALKGIGYGQAIGSVGVATYYCTLMAITGIYFVNSFTSDLPWATCRPEWQNTGIQCIPSNSVGTPPPNSLSSSEMYFKLEVLREKTDISDGIGDPDWRLTISLLVSWTMTFFVSRNGVQSSGKASYFLALFPYIIMFTLLGRAVSLEGAGDGITYFIEPQWHMLKSAQVWYAAVTQCFFSLNVGFGTIIMYSSYNDFKHNIYRDALVVSFMDTFTSLLAGFTIFGILGHLKHKKGVAHIKDVIRGDGTALAFISYPEAIAMFEAVPWLFALLFFLMLFILGTGSLIALQGSAFTIIVDTFPSLKKWHVTLGCCIGGFLIGLVYITPGGQYIVTLVDYFGGTFIFYILTTLEVITIFWWYGLENFCNDMEFMLGKRIGIYWRLTWGLLTPIVLLFIFIYSCATMEPLTHEDREFPDHVLAWGWVIVGVALMQIFIWWAYYILHKQKVHGIEKSFSKSLSHDKWGPQNPQTRKEWEARRADLNERRVKANLPMWKEKLYILIGKKFY